MEISHNQSARAASGATAPAEEVSALSSDFETFLTMLTVQMKNQDPLNPIDSADFAVQLATFSGVEQQVQTNDLLTALSQQMGLSGLSQMAGWVGMEARVAAPVLFDGEPIVLNTEVAAGADHAYLIVEDANGSQIERVEISTDGGPIDWAGVDENGTPLPNGVYSFTVESVERSVVISSELVETYSGIVEARTEDGEIMLVLDTGEIVANTDITAIRAPES